MLPETVRLVGGLLHWSSRSSGHPRYPYGSRARAGWAAATITVAAVLVVAVGCSRRPRKVPYIPPDLADWSEAYHSPEGLRLHVFATTGSLSPPGGVLGGSWLQHVTLEVPAFLIEHPRAGLTVVGTGLAPELGGSPEKYLGWFLAEITSVTVKDEQDLVSQLKAAGFAPEKVRRVILPDCRFPETGQIARFPEAEVVAARAERDWALQGGLSSAVRRADVLAIRRWETIDFTGAKPLGTFSRAHDLLGDGSVLLLDAPGYTPGTMAVLVRLASGAVVLAGGVAPLKETLLMPVIPALATDKERWWDSAWRLKRFRELAAGLLVVPGFDTSDLASKARGGVQVHRAESGAGERREPKPVRRQAGQPSFPVQDPPTSPPPLDR